MDQVLKRRFDAIDAPIDRRSVMTELPSGKHFVKLSDRRAAPESASTGERTVASRELPPHTLRRTVIPIKFFHAAAVMLAITALGVGQSAAQTGAPSPGGIGATSPLGADFGQTSGDDSKALVRRRCQSRALYKRTSWRGRAIHIQWRRTEPNERSFTTSGFTTSGLGAASGTSTPCNSVSSSGVTSTPNSAATTTPSANSSSSASSASSSFESPTTATANSSPNTGEPWRNRPRHERSRYDGTRDDRPRLTADPVRIDIANSNVAINSDPIRDIVFRRPRHAADEHQYRYGAKSKRRRARSGAESRRLGDRRGATASAARRAVPVTPVPCPTTSQFPE